MMLLNEYTILKFSKTSKKNYNKKNILVNF